MKIKIHSVTYLVESGPRYHHDRSIDYITKLSAVRELFIVELASPMSYPAVVSEELQRST